jgi:type II secretory pathway pseudopilin PulG
MPRRSGATLVEVLVVVAILALLVGLLLPAVQKVRLAAARAEFANQLRQVNIGFANYSSVEKWPPAGAGTILDKLRTYLDSRETIGYENHIVVLNYVNRYDPSYDYYPTDRTGNCSLALNALVLRSGARPDSVPDGSSNTLLFSERYARCRYVNVMWPLNKDICIDLSTDPPRRIPCTLNGGIRAPSFADPGYTDVLPIPGPTPGTTVGSVPGYTFQTRVKPSECDARVLQASFPAGLIVGLADGSVRTLSPNITPTVFWAAVTPDGGEVLSNW